MTTATMSFSFLYQHHECWCRLRALGTMDDYGVHGSPTWFEPFDWSIDDLEVDGKDYTEADAISAFGPGIINTITAEQETRVWEVQPAGYDDDWD